MKRIAALILGLSFLTGTANAQIILGSGIGKDCYDSALLYEKPRLKHIERCTEAIESKTVLGRNLAATYVNRGILYMRTSDFVSAIEDYDQALRIRPNLGAAFLNKGAALIEIGRPTEAIPVLLKSIELNTVNEQAAHYNLGVAYELTGDVTSAYRSLNKALELRPDWDLPKAQLRRYSVVSEG